MKGFNENLETMKKMMEAKNHDYGATEDAFNNFRNCERLGICSAEKGILVRMSDKLSRASTLLNKEAKVEDEKIRDTIIDLCVYGNILLCLLEEKNNGKKN